MENVTNIGRFCVMDTSHKRLGSVCINMPSMKIICFNLKWETFVGHCFGCGEWGHFMAECQHLCHSIMEIPMKGMVRKELGEMLCQIFWLLPRNIIRKDAQLQSYGPKNKGHQYMDLLEQSEVLMDKDKNNN